MRMGVEKPCAKGLLGAKYQRGIELTAKAACSGMRGWKSTGAGDVHDGVSHGDAQEDDDDDVADASHGAAAVNVIARKCRENAPTTRKAHGVPSMMPMARSSRWLKPKDLQKVAQRIADELEKVV